MKTDLTNYLCVMGLMVQGDVGPITCYRSVRHALVWFPKAPPKKPFSPLQVLQKEKWQGFINDWNDLPLATRLKWELITKRASLSIQGLNLYIFHRSVQDDSYILTLERQTHITVL